MPATLAHLHTPAGDRRKEQVNDYEGVAENATLMAGAGNGISSDCGYRYRRPRRARLIR